MITTHHRLSRARLAPTLAGAALMTTALTGLAAAATDPAPAAATQPRAETPGAAADGGAAQLTQRACRDLHAAADDADGIGLDPRAARWLAMRDDGADCGAALMRLDAAAAGADQDNPALDDRESANAATRARDVDDDGKIDARTAKGSGKTGYTGAAEPIVDDPDSPAAAADNPNKQMAVDASADAEGPVETHRNTAGYDQSNEPVDPGAKADSGAPKIGDAASDQAMKNGAMDDTAEKGAHGGRAAVAAQALSGGSQTDDAQRAVERDASSPDNMPDEAERQPGDMLDEGESGMDKTAKSDMDDPEEERQTTETEGWSASSEATVQPMSKPLANGEMTDGRDRKSDGAGTASTMRRAAMPGEQDGAVTTATVGGGGEAPGDGEADARMSGLEQMKTDVEDREGMNVGTLLSYEVVNADGETLGDAEDIVKMDNTLYLVVGHGGFLGYGDEEVMLPLNRATVHQERLVLEGVIEEDLDAMKAWDENGGQTLGRASYVPVARY